MTGFHVLIHAPLYDAVRQLPAEVRSRFRRQIARLRDGQWGGGVRVKKLRGVGKPVFEARHDAGARLLFTLAHTAARDAVGTLPAHLQIWDLVGHDAVSRRAAGINPSAEAEFLDFEEVEAELISEPPPLPAAAFADVPALEPGRESGLLELLLPPASLRPPEREELVGGVRWYVLPEHLVVDEARWQTLMDAGAEELELKLTGEQYQVARAPGPVLLSGSAGSGKTTIAVHRLVAAACDLGHPQVAYVTYSPSLLDHARRLFGDLVACRGGAVGVAPSFLTVHDLYRAIVGEVGAAAHARVADYPDFARWYAGIFARDDTALAWEEIRSIVKGASLDPARPLLGRDDYEALGRKRAPLFVAERPRLYHVARRWQEHLAASGLTDEIELCRRALARVPAGGLYDHLVCDEAQDLTEIQIELLLRLLRQPSLTGLFIAGDPQQVINPSGFRWAEVRSRIRDRFADRGRPVPQLAVLTRNFRSVRGVVNLANAVLAFKRERVGRSDSDQPEEAVVAGAAPILVAGDEAELIEAIRDFGPRCAIVAGATDDRSRLESALGTSRVFTIPEAKGLEFDAVVLWGVVAADPGPWRRLLEPAADLHDDPGARRALHHLYVATTRARRHLAVYEPAGAPPVWTTERFSALLDPEPPASLARLFVRSASPGEWRREGEYFEERGRHRQAAECFRRAGEARREAESLARHHEASGELAVAAEHWLGLGEIARAARCLESAEDYGAAAREWARAGDEPAAGRCRARVFEAARRWAEAAAAWEELEALDHAARCWANAGVRPRQIRCLALAAEREGRPASAAPRWLELEEWERAAVAWRAAGREADATTAEARAHEAAARWEEAAHAWNSAGDVRRELSCRAQAAASRGHFADAARAWEEAGDLPAAVRAWQRAGEPAESQRCGARRDLADGRFVRAAETFEELGDFTAAASAWARAAAARQQPAAPRPLPLPPAATRPWSENGKPARLARPPSSRRYSARAGAARRGPTPGTLHPSDVRAHVCAARAAEDRGCFDEAVAAWRALGDVEQVLRCRVMHLDAAGRDRQAAALLEGKERYKAAAIRWRSAGDLAAASRCEARQHEKKGRLEEAAAVWTALGEKVNAARCRGNLHFRREEFEEAAQQYDEAGQREMAVVARVLAAKLRADYDGAVRVLEEAGMQDQRATMLGDRTRWLIEARQLVASRERERRRASGPGGARRQTAFFGPDVGDAPHAADMPPPSRTGLPRVDAVLDAVRRSPGLTCEELARLTRLPTAGLKPVLATLVERRLLRKAGRTRGTRYLPA